MRVGENLQAFILTWTNLGIRRAASGILWRDPSGTERRMGGSERPLHDTGNHCRVEPHSPRWAARRSDLTNTAQTGEGGDQAKLVTPR